MGISVLNPPAVSGGKIMKRTMLTSGTSYTVPAGVTDINVTCVGGGGGAGAVDGNQQAHDRPHGSGGQIVHSTLTTTPGSSINYSIGAGGSGANAGNVNGGTGGTTSFTGATSASGGTGGRAPQDNAGVTVGTSFVSAMNGGGVSTSSDGGTHGGGTGGSGCIIVEYWV
jgi:hypothetical protein